MGGSEKQLSERDSGVAVSTKTGLPGQASENWTTRVSVLFILCALAGPLGGCGDHGNEGTDCPESVRASTISGFCIPRYVSLKRDTVTARKGPGVDYPALWIYRARGLPVQVVAETLDWRRICDPDGGAVWVHRSMVDGRRTVEATAGEPIPLLRAPKDAAPVEGLLRARALAVLDRCAGGWCKVTVGGVTGWASAARLWGVAPAAQCR